MRADEIRFLFAYDRWATRRVLNALDGLDPAVWARMDVVGERGLGSILVHQLGSSQRWRILFEARATDERVKPELEPLPSIDELRAGWEAEWAAVDAWLQTLTDGSVANVHEGVPVWQLLVHVVNHGTQHRAEAAALLTAEGDRQGSLICSTSPKSKPTAAASHRQGMAPLTRSGRSRMPQGSEMFLEGRARPETSWYFSSPAGLTLKPW